MKGNNNLIIDLVPKLDKRDNIYHLGKIKFPGRIIFNNSVTFLIFLSEEDEEEIQIAVNDKENTKFSSYTERPGKIEISLTSKVDSYDKKFYVAKVQFDGYLDCSKDTTFLVFSSQEGREELQISGNIVTPNSTSKEEVQLSTEVIKLRNIYE